MPEIQLRVHPAHLSDIDRIQALIQQARRTYVWFGYEDLSHLIEGGYCFVADTGPLLWGLLCASIRHLNLAQIRGVGLINGWQVDTGIARLWHPLESALRQNHIQQVMYVATEAWPVPAFLQQGFGVGDYIINMKRAAPTSPLLPQHQLPDTRLRFLAANDIETLTVLDQRTFDWPWHFSDVELIELLMTTSRLVVLDYRGEVAGYSCTDIRDEQAQIVRLAVDPQYQSQGLGRYLLADAVDFATAAGARTIHLNTQQHNRSARRLYQRFGFRPIGRRIPVLLKELHLAS